MGHRSETVMGLEVGLPGTGEPIVGRFLAAGAGLIASPTWARPWILAQVPSQRLGRSRKWVSLAWENQAWVAGWRLEQSPEMVLPGLGCGTQCRSKIKYLNSMFH